MNHIYQHTTVPFSIWSKKLLIALDTRRMIRLRTSPNIHHHNTQSVTKLIIPNWIEKFLINKRNPHRRSHNTRLPPSKQIKQTSSSSFIFFTGGGFAWLRGGRPRFRLNSGFTSTGKTAIWSATAESPATVIGTPTSLESSSPVELVLVNPFWSVIENETLDSRIGVFE